MNTDFEGLATRGGSKPKGQSAHTRMPVVPAVVLSLVVLAAILAADVTAFLDSGLGSAYQATDTKLNRQVTLTIRPEAVASVPDRRSRFEREATFSGR